LEKEQVFETEDSSSQLSCIYAVKTKLSAGLEKKKVCWMRINFDAAENLKVGSFKKISVALNCLREEKQQEESCFTSLGQVFRRGCLKV